MQPPIRIAVLEADTPLPKTEAKYGGYGGVIKDLVRKGAKVSGRMDPDTGFELCAYQVELNPDRYPNLDDVDAIIISGSRHDSWTDVPWVVKLTKFTEKILAQDRVRIIGICFGHQIVGRALGAKVGRNDGGWEAAVHDVQLSGAGQRLFGKDVLQIHHMHRDVVHDVPRGVELLGSSPVCKVQGLYAKNRLFTTQGHPEFTEDIIREIIETRNRAGVFNDDAYQTHMKKVALQHDGVLVAKAFIKFLLDD